MAGEISVTLVGTTTAPAELRFVPSGAAVCSWTLAVNPRRFDKQAGEWKEQPAQFYRCSVWRDAAENAAEVLTEKGMRLVVTGTLNPREFTDKDGVKRLSLDVEVEEVAPSLRYATARVTKTQRGGGNGGNGGNQSTPARPSAPADDPWASTSGSSEPPF